jgi:hypothetical protein
MIKKARIKQVIPCTENIKMCFWSDEVGKIFRAKVHYLAVVNFDGDECLCPLGEASGGFFIPVIEMGDYLGMEMDDETRTFDEEIEDAKKVILAAKKNQEWREKFANR